MIALLVHYCLEVDVPVHPLRAAKGTIGAEMKSPVAMTVVARA